MSNFSKDYNKIVEDIKYGRIYSSTETVITALKMLKNTLYEGGNKEAINRYRYLAEEIINVRPTSALLINSIRELTREIIEGYKERGIKGARERANNTYDMLRKKILQSMETSASIASKRIEDGDTILTNSYSIYVKKTLEKVKDSGKEVSVYIPESRPGSEGLKLAEEISQMGFDVTLIVDSAVRYVMKEIDKVLLASEAIAANGALINKVGTSLIALAANEARVRVFVVSSTLKFSPETFLGEIVEIVEADPNSIISKDKLEEWQGKVKVRAPLFDVTPPEYIDAIITERGLIAPQVVVLLIREMYGWPPHVLNIEEELRELRRVTQD